MQGEALRSAMSSSCSEDQDTVMVSQPATKKLRGFRSLTPQTSCSDSGDVVAERLRRQLPSLTPPREPKASQRGRSRSPRNPQEEHRSPGISRGGGRSGGSVRPSRSSGGISENLKNRGKSVPARHAHDADCDRSELRRGARARSAPPPVKNCRICHK